VLSLKEINALQKVDYRYNTRGQLTHINDPYKLEDDVFGYQMNYDRVEQSRNVLSTTHKPMYNGNISQVLWATGSDASVKDYKYGYDALNRLKSAAFSDSNYNLTNVTYDKNGNITRLQRNLHDGNQDLIYGYNGNQLMNVGGTRSNTTGIITVAQGYTYDTTIWTYPNGLLSKREKLSSMITRPLGSSYRNDLLPQTTLQ